MKLFFIFSALVVISHQQFQYRALPRELVWLSHYPPRDVPDHYLPVRLYNDYLPFRPSSRIGAIHLQNEDYDQNFENTITHNIVDDDSVIEFPDDTQSRAKGVLRWPSVFYKKNGGRIFYSSTINNPFFKTATFTYSTTVTTIGSIVLCVPSNNLAAVPAPTCSGRKRRESEDSDNDQFPISPSETIKFIPTALTRLDSTLINNRESRRLPMGNLQMNPPGVSSSKDVSSVAMWEDINETNPREKRFFGGGIVVSTTATSYSFVGVTLTSTVLLDPTGANLANCLPSGYVVCA